MEWKNIRIKKDTVKRLRILKAKKDFHIYDDVLNYLFDKEERSDD